MKRLAAIVAVLAIVAACSSGPDPNRLRFEQPKIFAAPVGPVTFTVGPDDTVYYAELRTFDVYSVRRGELPNLLFHSHFKPDSLAVSATGIVFVAARSQSHRLFISRYIQHGDEYVESLVWAGPTDRFAAHLAIARNGAFVFGWHTRLFRLNANAQPPQSAHVLSGGYTDPVVTFGRGEHFWVADNALPGKTERVAGTKLPPYTNPSGLTVLNTEILLCSRTHQKVFRLHIDDKNVPHWRKNVGELKCDRDIGVLSDGSVITAQTSVIYRYPPRR